MNEKDFRKLRPAVTHTAILDSIEATDTCTYLYLTSTFLNNLDDTLFYVSEASYKSSLSEVYEKIELTYFTALPKPILLAPHSSIQKIVVFATKLPQGEWRGKYFQLGYDFVACSRLNTKKLVLREPDGVFSTYWVEGENLMRLYDDTLRKPNYIWSNDILLSSTRQKIQAERSH
jgi:hypothetical protein